VTYQPPEHDSAAVKNATEARQGARGRPVLWVLLVGIGLMVIALLYFMSTDVSDPPPNPVAEEPVGPSSGGAGTPEPSRIEEPPAGGASPSGEVPTEPQGAQPPAAPAQQ
jgi:hypothetical protein